MSEAVLPNVAAARLGVDLECGDGGREINRAIRAAVASGSKASACSIRRRGTTWGSALPEGVELLIEGSWAIMSAGLNDGAHGARPRRSGLGGWREHADGR